MTAAGGNPLPYLIKTPAPKLPTCPHLLGRWLIRTSKSTQTFRDGGRRVTHRGGRLVKTGDPCTQPAGHDGPHTTGGGRSWS